MGVEMYLLLAKLVLAGKQNTVWGVQMVWSVFPIQSSHALETLQDQIYVPHAFMMWWECVMLAHSQHDQQNQQSSGAPEHQYCTAHRLSALGSSKMATDSSSSGWVGDCLAKPAKPESMAL